VLDALPAANPHLSARPYLREKPIHHRGLANPQLAHEEYNLTLASLCPRKGSAQPGKFPLAAYEDRGWGLGARGWFRFCTWHCELCT
jgi:hypothetical protein